MHTCSCRPCGHLQTLDRAVNNVVMRFHLLCFSTAMYRTCATMCHPISLLFLRTRADLPRGGYLTKSPGMLLLCKLYFNHITRLLAEFGVKCMPLAWEGAQPLFLAYFGINSLRMPSTRPNHTSFYPQNTINILFLCCKSILDVETEVWRILTHFGTPYADF